MGTYSVRVAGFDELDATTAYRLWQLRSEVFVVEQQCAYLDLDGRDTEPGTRHVWAQAPTEPGAPVAPVAYLRVLDDVTTARVGRVVVAAPHRGEGIAATLMGRAHELCEGRPVVLDAQSHLAGWYAGLGYVLSGPEFLDDGIPHVPMRRD